MKVSRAYKYRLYPTTTQECSLTQFVGNNRFFWNFILAAAKDNKWNRYSVSKGLPFLKRELPFLKLSPSQALQQVLIDMDKAFSTFFKRRGGYPNFKKHGIHDSFRIPVVRSSESINANRSIWIPKLGFVGLRLSRKIRGEARSLTVSKKAGKWFVSILVIEDVEGKVAVTGKSAGIDLGVKHFATTSNGKHIDGPEKVILFLERRIDHMQKRISRSKKRSQNRNKLKLKLQRLYLTLSNVKEDFLHKVSTALIKSHDLLVLEDLSITKMSESGKGKAKLNRAILRQGWYKFRTFLEYKSVWYGCKVLFVPPQFTSQRCNLCGNIDKRNRKTQALFKCLNCGHSENADINAAKNIFTVGQTGRAFGATALAGR